MADYREWTFVEDLTECNQLRQAVDSDGERLYAELAALWDDEEISLFKQMALLSDAEREVCRQSHLAAARRAAQMAMYMANECERRFGEKIEISSEIFDLASDQSSDKPQ